MAAAEGAIMNMLGQFWDEWHMIFRYTELMGWMVGGKESIEKTVESAFAYETDIANLHGAVKCCWTGIPQGMSIRRICVCKLPTKDVIMGH